MSVKAPEGYYFRVFRGHWRIRNALFVSLRRRFLFLSWEVDMECAVHHSNSDWSDSYITRNLDATMRQLLDKNIASNNSGLIKWLGDYPPKELK